MPDTTVQRSRTDEIAEIVEKIIPHTGLSSAARLLSCDRWGNPYSETLRVEIRDGEVVKAFWVKIPKVKKDNANLIVTRMRTEFEILSHLDAALSDQPALNVVRPIATLDAPFALVTEERPGPTLQKLLTKRGRFPAVLRHKRQLETLCQRSGEWLRRFHHVTRQQDRAPKFQETIDYCEDRLALLQGLPQSGITPDIAARIRARLETAMRSAQNENTLVAGRHNDFAGHNIIVGDNDSISVLDFSMFDYDSNAFDCYNFIHKIEAISCDPAISSIALKNALISAFKAGYGTNFPESAPLKDIVYCRLNLAKLLTRAEQKPKPFPKSVGQIGLRQLYLGWLLKFSRGAA